MDAIETGNALDDLAARLRKAEGRVGTFRGRLAALENVASAPFVVTAVRDALAKLERLPEAHTGRDGTRADQCRAFLRAVDEAGAQRRKTAGRAV